MTDDAALADEILGYLPAGIGDRFGSMLMSGRSAWTGERPLYILGFNPGGASGTGDTVASHTEAIWRHESYSSFVHESWAPGGRVRPTGEAPLQKSVRYVLDGCGLDPREVPASNVNFIRSATEDALPLDDWGWAEKCWPFHDVMIERLGVRVVLCFGKNAANFVREKVGSHDELERIEHTSRQRSIVYTGGSVTVIQAAHPGRFHWYLPKYDILPLVRHALTTSAARGNRASTT